MKVDIRTLLVVAALAIATVAYAQQRTDTGAAWTHSEVTPSDSATLLSSNGNFLCRALFINTGGDIAIEDSSNNEVIYTVGDGTLLPFRPYRVLSTGTTAMGIVCWLN